MNKLALMGGFVGCLGLVGCGSSSDSGPSVKEYSLDGYKGRSVSTQSIQGTWVMVSNVDGDVTSPEGNFKAQESIKEAFIFVEDQGTLFKLNCDGSFASFVSISGNTLSLNGLSATLSNNSALSFVQVEQESANGVSYRLSYEGEAVKISDSILPLATLSVASDDDNDFSNLGCVAQSNGYFDEGGSVSQFETVQTDNVELERFTGSEGYTAIYTDLPDYLEFDTDFGHIADFSIDTISDNSQLISFNGSHSFDSVSGTINVNLPAQ